MIRIALCDDNEKELSALARSVRAFIGHKSYGDTIQMDTFSSSLKILYQLEEKEIYDIYILDIDMPHMNGLQLARSIRDSDPIAIIFFLTSHMEFASEGYKVEALRYVHKSESSEQLYEALDHAILKCTGRAQDCVTVTHYRDTIRIPYAEIMYVRRSSRVLEIHTRTLGVYTDRRGIRDFYKLLNPRRFLFIDRGTILNVDYIQRTERDSVVLFNKEQLAINHRRILEVKQAIADTWI